MEDKDVANVSLLLNKDFKQTRFARLNNNTYLYIKKSSNKKVKKQHTRKIEIKNGIIIQRT